MRASSGSVNPTRIVNFEFPGTGGALGSIGGAVGVGIPRFVRLLGIRLSTKLMEEIR